MSPVVSIIATVAYYVFLLFFLLMWGRFIVDMVRAFSRSWRPRGVGLVAVETMYAVTDPPVRFFRKVIPPVSLGPVSLDLGWSVTMLVCIVGMYVTVFLR